MQIYVHACKLAVSSSELHKIQRRFDGGSALITLRTSVSKEKNARSLCVVPFFPLPVISGTAERN